MMIALAALDIKMHEKGIVTLDCLQMENSALKALSSEIRVQLTEASKRMKGETRFGEELAKRHAALVLRARIKSNGRMDMIESFVYGLS